MDSPPPYSPLTYSPLPREVETAHIVTIDYSLNVHQKPNDSSANSFGEESARLSIGDPNAIDLQPVPLQPIPSILDSTPLELGSSSHHDNRSITKKSHEKDIINILNAVNAAIMFIAYVVGGLILLAIGIYFLHRWYHRYHVSD